MSTIKLKNVSKFYYSKGVIASGFTKINLEFDMGQFVAITGESGSGKSTLLNVISGLDTYEEGEMYINGKETSHYTDKDFEDYRRKYIGNIFQNFNLVNSYTVYQNIELVLLLNGSKKKEIKEKVLDLIKQVGLTKFKNTKVSKLSGGQKQRVAIARALAKDTPIIIADEPTGNLDSKSAKEIIKLLSEISKNKLVIIVTHNYEQVESYVTRKIKMHDGRILEDKILKEVDCPKEIETVEYKNIRPLNKLRLGIRNTYNIILKFLLVLAVYLFIVVALMSEYSSFKEQEYISETTGYNNFFQDTSDNRVIIKKTNKEIITDVDYDNISSLDNIKYIVKSDLLIDSYISITDNNSFWISGPAYDINNLDGSLNIGRMPENDNEIVLVGSKDDYYLGYNKEELLNTTLYIQNNYTSEVDEELPLKVVGIKYIKSNNYSTDSKIYTTSTVLEKLEFQISQQYSDIQILFADTYHKSYQYENSYKLTPSQNVQQGNVIISDDYSYMCPKENCKNQPLSVIVNNLYYDKTIDLTVTNTYTKKNMQSLLNQDYDNNNGAIYISIDDYNSLFNKDNYQSSIYVKDVTSIDNTIEKLQSMGYTTLKIKDTLVTGGALEVMKIFKAIVTIILVATLFFISYFVIRIILKSRNVYFATLRMLGATKKINRQLLIIELLNVSNIAYFLFIFIILLNNINIINIGFINTILTYLKLSDYILLYITLIVISYLISIKFAKNLFKKSAVTTRSEEV